ADSLLADSARAMDALVLAWPRASQMRAGQRYAHRLPIWQAAPRSTWSWEHPHSRRRTLAARGRVSRSAGACAPLSAHPVVSSLTLDRDENAAKLLAAA